MNSKVCAPVSSQVARTAAASGSAADVTLTCAVARLDSESWSMIMTGKFNIVVLQVELSTALAACSGVVKKSASWTRWTVQ